jgi:hypothetical protein
MRRVSLVLLALVVLAGCAGSQPYSALDLKQVRQAYAAVRPVYWAFRAAYIANNYPAMKRLFAQEQRACHIEDVVDKRDTIDPNVNLYQASSQVNSFCNDIETAYAAYRKAHAMPYDELVNETLPGTYFEDGDYNMQIIGRYLGNPAKRCCPVVAPTPATPIVTVPPS